MDNQTHYSEIEIEELIERLTDAQIGKILHVYRNKGCLERAGLTDQDVFQNVVVQALSTERPWGKGLPVEAYMIVSGKSYISNEAEKYARNICESQSDGVQIESFASEDEDYTDNVGSESFIQAWVEKILHLFADDKDASCFLEKKLAQIKRAQILILCEFTDQVYRNVEKRIKDKTRKRFPAGIPFSEAGS